MILAEEYSKKRKNKVFYEIRPSECPIKRTYCRKYERTIVASENINEILGDMIKVISEKKSIPKEEAEKIILEMMGFNDANKTDVVIPENYEACKYLKSNGLGNEDGILYIECGCIQKAIKFICEDE
jgi:hypothetical protein